MRRAQLQEEAVSRYISTHHMDRCGWGTDFEIMLLASLLTIQIFSRSTAGNFFPAAAQSEETVCILCFTYNQYLVLSKYLYTMCACVYYCLVFPEYAMLTSSQLKHCTSLRVSHVLTHIHVPIYYHAQMEVYTCTRTHAHTHTHTHTQHTHTHTHTHIHTQTHTHTILQTRNYAGI